MSKVMTMTEFIEEIIKAIHESYEDEECESCPLFFDCYGDFSFSEEGQNE